MSKEFVLLFMIFCHVIDDFFIQSAGCLHFLKQQDFWKKEAPEKIYRHDYIIALIMHAFSWSFMIMLPIFIYYSFSVTTIMVLIFMINSAIHAMIDHTKANMKIINLVTDQSAHICQIILTYALLINFV